MADEIFALSPIAARPVQPSEQDYDAIKEAFMETSRGRWFLGEYAKRNRNADTKMVLDAVARIEETIAAQKKPARDPLLDEALAAFRAALAETRDAANAAVNGLAIEQNLAPVRKGARVIREIAWRLREIGADGRICDLIDSQVAAIEGAAARFNPSGVAAALAEAFDRIDGKIATFEADGAAPAASGAPIAEAPAAEVAEVAPAAETEFSAEAQAETGIRTPAEIEGEQPAEPRATMQASSVTHGTEAATETKIATGLEASAEAAIAAAGPAIVDQPSMAATAETGEPIDAFDAGDEAVLDMVAMEMAAPDTDEAYEPKLEDVRAYEEAQTEPRLHDARAEQPQAEASRESAQSWEIDVTFASDAGRAAEEPGVAAAQSSVPPRQPETEPQPEPAGTPAHSLGSSLIASGIVPRPRAPRPDPMAPIRRMTQNEKIAFFS
jgi:hypothetical protein